MIKYLKRTWKNKAVASAMMVLGCLSTFVDGDATGCVFLMLLAIPLFLAGKNYID